MAMLPQLLLNVVMLSIVTPTQPVIWTPLPPKESPAVRCDSTTVLYPWMSNAVRWCAPVMTAVERLCEWVAR